MLSYAALSYLTLGTGGQLTSATLAGGGDSWSFVWLLQWWPWALSHGLNPFVTDLIWFPGGINLAWATSVPTLALAAWPVTLLWGPIFSFNALTLLAPAAGAWTAFLLARRISGNPWAAWVCGFVFGFSAYETGHLQGHLNLDTICLIPVLIHLPLRRLAGDWSARRHVIGMACVLLLQFGISTEVFATACLFGFVTWAILLLCATRPDRGRLARLACELAVAAALTAVLAGPYLYYVVRGLTDLPPVINSPLIYAANPLNFVIPTRLTWLGGGLFPSLSARFSGNMAEQGAYAGLPLIIIFGLFHARRRAPRAIRALLLLTLCLVVCSLGPGLWWNGAVRMTGLPWGLAEHLPLIRSALPGRFTLYVPLAMGLAASLWLAQPSRGWGRAARWVLAGLACAALIPNPALVGRIPTPSLPSIPQTGAGRPVALVLPFGPAGPGMIWQAQSGYNFVQSAGYLGFTPLTEDESVLGSLQTGALERDFVPRFEAYAVRHHLTAVAASPGTPPALIDSLAAAGWALSVQAGTSILTAPDLAGVPTYAIRGDYWSDPEAGWLGGRARVITRGQAVRVRLTASRPDGVVTAITVTIDGVRTAYTLLAGQSMDFAVGPTANTAITASPAFVPDGFFHNGDDRALTVRMDVWRE